MGRISYFLFLPAILLLSFLVGCEANEDNSGKIIGSWRLVSFNERGDSRILQPDESECEDCYTVTFNEDGTIAAKSQINDMGGNFLLEDSHISIIITFTTEVLEIGDGPVFTQALENVSDFDFEGETLMLYFSKNSFLSFKQK